MAEQHTNVTIDRLNIRLKGVSASAAQAAVKDLGSHLLHHLAGRQEPGDGTVGRRIKTLDAGMQKLQSGESKDPSGLRARIVSGITGAIDAHDRRSGPKE